MGHHTADEDRTSPCTGADPRHLDDIGNSRNSSSSAGVGSMAETKPAIQALQQQRMSSAGMGSMAETKQPYRHFGSYEQVFVIPTLDAEDAASSTSGAPAQFFSWIMRTQTRRQRWRCSRPSLQTSLSPKR